MLGLLSIACAIELEGSFLNLNKTYMQVEDEGCHYCEVEIAMFDMAASPEAPLVPKDNWVGVRCDQISGEGAAVAAGSQGLIAFAHVTNGTWAEKVQNNDLVFFGTYTNEQIINTVNLEPDYHTLSVFHENIEIDISPFHIEFEGFAVAGLPNDWIDPDNSWFKCSWYNSADQIDPYDFTLAGWTTSDDVFVQTSQCLSVDEVLERRE